MDRDKPTCSPSPMGLPLLRGDLDLALTGARYVVVTGAAFGYLSALAVLALNPADTRLLVEVFLIYILIN